LDSFFSNIARTLGDSKHLVDDPKGKEVPNFYFEQGEKVRSQASNDVSEVQTIKTSEIEGWAVSEKVNSHCIEVGDAYYSQQKGRPKHSTPARS
jgi:hypothetical protein